MRLCTLTSLCLVLSCAPAFAEIPKPTGDAIVSPDAKLEKLFTREAPIKGGLTEGPAVAPDGSIYFSDIPFSSNKGMIIRFDPTTMEKSVFTDDSFKSNGLKFDGKGNLFACEGSDEGGRAVVRWDVKTKKRTVLGDKYMGKRFNAPNDLVLDTKGRIYFSDPRYLGAESRELEYRRQDAVSGRPQQWYRPHRRSRCQGAAETRRHEDLRLPAGSRWSRERPAEDAR
jgi:sugar lactone lactonase YvrE